MSSLLDSVEAEVARAKRAFRQSGSIIVAARNELESHGRWLDRHLVARAEEVKRYRRLLNRKMAIRAFLRFAVGLILAAPFALAQALTLSLKERPSRTSSQLSFVESASRRTRHDQLKSFLKGKVVVFALGFITLFIVAAVAIRATTSSPPAKAPVLAAPKVSGPRQAAASMTVVPKTPGRAQRPTSFAGFAVLATASASEPLLLPAQTVADMMLITSPSALAPMGPETTTAPIAKEPLATKPAVKAKPKKRKLAGPEPQQLPWWQRWSWIRVR